MTDDTGKPNATGWWRCDGAAVEVVAKNPRMDGSSTLMVRLDYGYCPVQTFPGAWGPRLYTEAEHTEAVRLAEERARRDARHQAIGAAVDRVVEAEDMTRELAEAATSLVRLNSEAAALRAELEAAKAERREQAQRLRDACSAPNDGPKALRDHVADVLADLAAARARIAEMEAHADRLTTIVDEAVGLQPVQPAEDTLTLLESHLYERRTDLARMEAERDEARVGWLRETWRAEADAGGFATPVRERAVATYGTEWADEHFPEGT